VTARRINHITQHLRYAVTCYVHRGLFERHKTMWTLMLAMRIQSKAGLLSDAAMDVLFKAGAALDIHTEKPKPFSWLRDAVWLNILQLSRTVKVFAELVEAINRNDILWKHWLEDDAPEEVRPPDFADKCNTFEMMLLVRCIREDRTLLCVSKYIIETLGRRFVDSFPLDLRAVEMEAPPHTPILVILSPGADPTVQIVELARQQKQKLDSVSLGRGQEPAARKLLAAGVAQGRWVLLQNCHLALGFMTELEATMRRLAAAPDHFQLWLTSEPHPKFPIGLLRTSIKVTNEAAAGVRAGLKGTYTWFSQETLDSVAHPAYRPLLFSLAFLHSALQERRKFGALGFCVPYEFNQADLYASVAFLQNHLREAEPNEPLDYKVLHYMICEVQYGGRITDERDRRLVNAYGSRWLAPAVLEPRFEFFPRYGIPDANEAKACRAYIDELPLIDDPELFGLHGNADLVFRTANTKTVLETIQSIRPTGDAGVGGPTREHKVLEEVEQLRALLPPDFKPGDAKAATAARSSVLEIGAAGGAKPLQIVLGQEVERLQLVIGAVRGALDGLKLAIAGSVVMSPLLCDASDALFEARVPAEWANLAQFSTRVLSKWFGQVVQHAEQLSNWLRTGRPTAFWLAGFFNPHGFLTANLQEVCRR